MAKKARADPPPKTGWACGLKDEAKPARHPSALQNTRDIFATLQ